MFGLRWLVDHNALAKARLEEFHSSYVAGIFRTVRFGAGEAHGRAEMMEFNYIQENRGLSQSGGRYVIDYARMPAVLAQLAKELLTIEATGDRARAESWFAKYDKMPAELTKALASTKAFLWISNRSFRLRMRCGERTTKGAGLISRRAAPRTHFSGQ